MAQALPITDWETQQALLQAQLASAQKLRERAQASRQNRPAGQMVGGFYVPNPWYSNITPLIDELRADQQEKGLMAQQQQLGQQMQGAADQWMQARPQSMTARLSGPTQDGTPLSGTVTAEAPEQDRLAWGQKGLQNPLTKSLAALYLQDQLVNAPERAEKRKDRQEEEEADRTFRDEQARIRAQERLEEIRIKLEDRALDRASREVLMREGYQLRRDIAGMMDATRRDIAKNSIFTRPVPEAVLKVMRPLEEQADNMKAVTSAFKPEYGGVRGGYVDRLAGTWLPGASDAAKNSAEWWKQYEYQAALVERHEKFGTALSSGEQTAWRNATIQPGMTPETIQRNLKIRSDLAEKVYRRTREQYTNAGYPQIGEIFPERGVPVTPPPAAPAAQVSSPDAAQPQVRRYNPQTGRLE